jgi:hypothetical protein
VVFVLKLSTVYEGTIKQLVCVYEINLILRWIFRKLEGVVGTGWDWLRIGTGGEHL